MAHVPSKMYSVERRAHRAGTPIVAPTPAAPANGEILAELRALRAEMAELRETVANGLQPVTAPLDDEDAMKRDVRVESRLLRLLDAPTRLVRGRSLDQPNGHVTRHVIPPDRGGSS